MQLIDLSNKNDKSHKLSFYEKNSKSIIKKIYAYLLEVPNKELFLFLKATYSINLNFIFSWVV